MSRNGKQVASSSGIRVSVYHEVEDVEIPEWVVDLESFRLWAHADDFPEIARIYWLRGQVVVDVSKEQLFTHGQVKTELTIVLGGQVKAQKLGYYWDDGPLVSNEEADIAVNPDGIFVSTSSLVSKKVRLLESIKEEGHVEIEGSPDMVLEVVSLRSVRKDTVILRDAYWKAGVQEYWLVDARRDPLSFEIFRYGENGYTAVRKQKGWLRSQVFGKSFRQSQSLDALNKPAFTLEVR